MNFTRVISNILNHPFNRQHKLKAFQRFIKWQLASKILNYPVIVPFTDKTWLIIKKGMTGATGNYYCGLHDFEDMVFLMHFLRKEDLFIDVGANIGSYTILSSGHVGANTISVEPVPSTFKNLMNNIAINHIIPAAIKYQSILVQNVEGMKDIGLSKEVYGTQVELIKEISMHITVIKNKVDEMVEARKKANAISDVRAHAVAFCCLLYTSPSPRDS